MLACMLAYTRVCTELRGRARNSPVFPSEDLWWLCVYFRFILIFIPFLYIFFKSFLHILCFLFHITFCPWTTRLDTILIPNERTYILFMSTFIRKISRSGSELNTLDGSLWRLVSIMLYLSLTVWLFNFRIIEIGLYQNMPLFQLY